MRAGTNGTRKWEKVMEDLKIIKLKVGDLSPYSKNAKLHPRSQIEKIKKSIQQFGK